MSTKRVLLVDDDPLVLEVIALTLERAGYEVLTAPDGEEALKLLSDVWHPVPDVIVTDVRMPRRGGPELLQEIGSDLRFAGVRTILMSSDAMAGKNVRCDAFMTKDRVACELIDTLVRLEGAPQ